MDFLNPALLDELKPSDMSLEELKKIVGPFYEYNEDVKNGRVNARTLQSRDISKIDIKEVFSINVYNLNVRESANQKRRAIELEQRKRRE